MKTTRKKLKNIIRIMLFEVTDLGSAQFSTQDPITARNRGKVLESDIHNIIFNHFYKDQNKEKVEKLKEDVRSLIEDYKSKKDNSPQKVESEKHINNTIKLLKEYLDLNENTKKTIEELNTRNEDDKKALRKNLTGKRSDFNCIPKPVRGQKNKIKCFHREEEEEENQGISVLFKIDNQERVKLDPLSDENIEAIKKLIQDLKDRDKEEEP